MTENRVNKVSTCWSLVGSLYGGLAVMLGAFGAHALKAKLDVYSLGIFETGARYQMYHALILVALGLVIQSAEVQSKQTNLLNIAGRFFAIGIFIFSGSLYAIALLQIKVLGILTPIGGVFLILGWAILVYHFGKMAKKRPQ
jgi:uncharacterized membrane protein YgdD (TMEM256/DUF423 family)